MASNKKAIQVNFFTNYEGDRQISMLRYADQLQSALQQYCGAICDVQRYSPAWNGKKAGAILSRWKRHVEYPMVAWRHRGPVNHIADHGNSHLVNYLPRLRTVITCHDLMTLKLSHIPGAPSKRYVMSFWAKVVQMRKAALIITDSQSNRQDIIDLLGIGAEKIHVVYLGVDHERFRPIEKEEQKEALKAKYQMTWPYTIFHVGAPTFYKNLEGIIETLSIVRQKLHADIHFVRVGPPLTVQQQALVDKRGLQACVHTLKSKSDAELRELYLASDVLLFPSWWEGFGLPPLEAFCCGTPVIVSDRPPIIEGTGSAALQVPPGDHEAMASAVAQVLEDASLRARLRAEGFAQASKFNWKYTAEGTAKIYQQLGQMDH